MLPRLCSFDDLLLRLLNLEHPVFDNFTTLPGLADFGNELPRIRDSVPLLDLTYRTFELTLPELILLEELGLKRDWDNRLELDWVALPDTNIWYPALFSNQTKFDNTYSYWRLTIMKPTFDTFERLFIVERGRNFKCDTSLAHPTSITLCMTCLPEIFELVNGLVLPIKCVKRGDPELFLKSID